MSQAPLSPPAEVNHSAPNGTPPGGASPNGTPPGGASPNGAPPEPAYKSGISITQVAIALIAIFTFVYLKPDVAKTVAIFVVTLSILVFVHEWGHFQFARWAGMKVNRFAIGFPPFIYTKRVNDINYSIGALPIGGMVDIAGLGSEEEMVATATGEAPTPVKNTTRVRGEKQFQDASLFWRFMTLFAGPLMNFIFAIVLAIGLLSIVGAPDLTTPGVRGNYVQGTLSSSPAARAGVQPGDLVVGVNDTMTDDAGKITQLLRKTPPGATVNLKLKRQDKIIGVPVKPELSEIPGVKGKVPTIGVSFDVDPATITNYKRLGVVDATKVAFASSYGMASGILGLVKRAFTGKLTAVDKGGVGGPVAIAKMAKTSSDSGFYQMALFAASLSINLGLLNLLPLPALDGGRILFLGYELVMRRPLDPRKEGLVHAAGMVLLLAFMLFITLRDVAPMISR